MKTRPARVALAICGGAAALWTLSLVVAFLIQGRLIFPAPEAVRSPVRSEHLLRIPSESGEVVALYRPAAPGRSTVVHFHGNAQQLADTEGWIATLSELGLGGLAVEYPGYGLMRERGAPSESGCYEAAETALTHLRERLGVPAEQIVCHGFSLGSGVATEMALRGHCARLVLLAPFTSILDEAARMLPWLPARWLTLHPFDNLSKAGGIRVPVLLIHGEWDRLTPPWMGARLASAFPGVRRILVPEAGHNTVLLHAPRALAACVDAFAGGDGKRCESLTTLRLAGGQP